MKRQHSSLQRKLNTVMEKTEKAGSAAPPPPLYLPRLDREGNPLGDVDYLVPSPPERDFPLETHRYPKTVTSPPPPPPTRLTRAELEAYTRAYHQKQPSSYAQSEGYHSYVSSGGDSTATPFLDRLRRDDAANRCRTSWEEEGEEATMGRESVATDANSVSSGETLKWRGSLSDVSLASSCAHPLIAHSAKVETPQKHDSESVLYMGGGRRGVDGWKDQEARKNGANKLRLFAVNTYTVEPSEQTDRLSSSNSSSSIVSSPPPPLSVADRVSVLEMQQKYSYLHPDKRHRIPDPALKAFQKKALLSFYERHRTASWRSEPQLARLPHLPNPPPPTRLLQPTRRASCASDYVTKKPQLPPPPPLSTAPNHRHSNSCGSLSSDLLGPLIVGPAISIDDWMLNAPPPQRPPKNPQLRELFTRPASPPDPPPPSPPHVLEDEVFACDEPLPPPPPEAAPQEEYGRIGRHQRASIAAGEEQPPPLQPRHARTNQSMRVRSRNGGYDMAGGRSFGLVGRCQSTTWVNSAGSYKRTMSPNGQPPHDSTSSNSSSSNLPTVKWLNRRASLVEKTTSPLVLPDVKEKKNHLQELPVLRSAQLAVRSISLEEEVDDRRSRRFSPLHNSILTAAIEPPPEIEEALIGRSCQSKSPPPLDDPLLPPPPHPQTADLRLNVSTTDAASQTEEKPHHPIDVVAHSVTRKKLQEEIDCERLSHDLIEQLSPGDRLNCLKDILIPDPDQKKPGDYVSGLFRLEATTARSRNCCSPVESGGGVAVKSSSTESPDSSPLSPTSAYYTTSEPKAKFLTRYSLDMQPYAVKDTKHLFQKKMELVNRLGRKLDVLRGEQLSLSEECRINDQLGEQVETRASRLARPNEFSKLRLHVEEVGKITSLLLGLSGRLARAENALMGMPEDHEERRVMETKRDKLHDQLQEAKKLKENIDRRGSNVSNILRQYVTVDLYTDYDHFINMKAKLIVDTREISDKIKLGEEQLLALKDTLAMD